MPRLAYDLLASSNQEIATSCFPDIEEFLLDYSLRMDKLHAAIFCLDAQQLVEKAAALQLKQVRRAAPHLPYVILSDCEDPLRIFAALGEGAQGYFPTSLNLALFIAALRLILAGGIYVPKVAIADAISRRTAKLQLPTKPNRSNANNDLTSRQQQVLNLMRQGRSNKHIATQLGVRESTVKVHVREIMKRLNASNRTHAVYLAQRAYGV